MLLTDELDFHPKYVAPFYSGLMNLNFTRREICKNPHRFIESVRQLKTELGNREIVQLLNHNWRPSKVGAWLIGLWGMLELERDLITYLHSRPVYCEHVIINLTLLNSKESSNALKEYINCQLKIIQKLTKDNENYKAIEVFERHSVNWGFDGLNYLDSINATKHYMDIIHSETWNSIKTEWRRISSLDSRAQGFYNLLQESEKRTGRLEVAMQIIKKEDKKE